MSTSTLHSENPLEAHVPVDRFTIVNGPSWTLLDMLDGQEMPRSLVRRERYMFMLTTPASSMPFRRTIMLDTVRVVTVEGKHVILFTGKFAGENVTGEYCLKSHSGSVIKA